MVVIFKALQVILALSILIAIHEFGHYFFARLFKIKVDKFYLFFDIGGVKLFSTKNNKFLHRFFPKLKDMDTDYGIGWLPLGGYCKINGMVDESMDTDFMKSEVQPYEFRSKKAWQRFLVMFGGVLFNFILAIFLYIGILAGWGEKYIENKGNSIYVNEVSEEMGFKNGDEIISFDDYIPENFSFLQADLIRQNTSKASLLRDGDTVEIYMDQSIFPKALNSVGLFDLAIPFIVDSITTTSINSGSILERGDKIISILGESIEYIQDSRELLSSYPNQDVPISFLRGKDTLTTNLRVDSLGRFGIFAQFPKIHTKDYSFIEAIPAGVSLAFERIYNYTQDLKMIAKPSNGAYKSVGSFISLGQIFPTSWNWQTFINILALLSIMLGVMNLLPIPALDGGHIVFILYEMISGKKPNEKFLLITQFIGIMLLFGLMILAFGNDISKLI